MGWPILLREQQPFTAWKTVLSCSASRSSELPMGPMFTFYLVAADEAKDSETVRQAGFIDLGPIKGNVGDQNYALGSDVDLSKYRAVSIWCQRFSVNFGAAPLRPDHSVSQSQTAK
jgi:hypothetical protein